METLNRREFLKRMTAGGAAAALSPLTVQEAHSRTKSGGGASGPRPNVLFLFSDDQRFDTIHSLGNEDIVTPNLDTLVRNGVAFTHAYIMGSTQGAVCVPSRAMLLTGRTLFRAPTPIPGNLALLPEVLRQAGYTTFGTGKWHNGSDSFARGFTAGGKIFFGGMFDHLKVPVHDFDPTGKYPREGRYTGEKFSSELFSDGAIAFLREYKGDKPFFVYVSYTAPHDPRMAPEKYAEMYDPNRIPLPKSFMPEHPFDNGEMKVRDEKLAPWPRTPEIVRRHIADYYAMITHLDDQIGRVVKALKATGHAHDTIIIFAADNGLAVGRHGLMGKQNLYEHSVRVPLIIGGPFPEGKQCRALCYLCDVFPTICELTGIPVPETVEGKSLVPLMREEKQELRGSIFCAYRDVQRMVRGDRYKLIEYLVEGTRKTQLFDLVSDPWEINDLSANPEFAKHVARLRKEMAKWQENVGDPMAGRFLHGTPS